MIDWAPIVEALTASDFDGYWAIEYENPPDAERGTKDSLDYLKSLL